MENKRKNVYVVIFVITTIVASCAAVYFKIMGDRKVKDFQIKLEEQKTLGEEREEDMLNGTSSNNNIEVEEKVVEKGIYPEIDLIKCLNKDEDAIYSEVVEDLFSMSKADSQGGS